MHDMQMYFMFIGLADFYTIFFYNSDALNRSNSYKQNMKPHMTVMK